jgi:hypothetical protein
MIEPRLRTSLLWLSLVLGMMLHFTFSISALQWGVDVVKPHAAGSVPWSNAGMKVAFYVVPLSFFLATFYVSHRLFIGGSLVLAGLFFFANTAHLIFEGLASFDPLGVAQACLMTTMVLLNAALVHALMQWWRARAE